MKYHNSEIVYKKVIDQLSKNKNIIIIVIKKYKGCGVVILDRTKYIDKFLPILTAKQFSKLDYDPTSKLQQTQRKIKSKLPEKVYKKVYPTRSCPGKFYKNPKVSANNVDDVKLRPIV